MLPQLRSFIVVIQEGSLHRAATRLNISQSALSRQMQALEHEVGGKLLERSSIGVAPTNAGRELARLTGSLLAIYDENLHAVRNVIRGHAGELRIGYLASAFGEYLGPAIEDLKRLLPKTKVKLLDLYPAEQIMALRLGNIDMALTSDRRNFASREFESKKIAVIKSIVCIGKEHPLAGREHLKMSQLKNETFTIPSESIVPGVRRWLMSLGRTCGKFSPKIVEVQGDLSDALSVIANDGMIAILPGFLHHYKRPGVTFVPVFDTAAFSGLFVSWQRGNELESLRTLVNALPSAE